MRSALFAVVVLAFPVLPQASAAADAEAGRRLAERWCTECHFGSAARTGSDAAPTLESLARENRTGAPGRSPDWRRSWLTAPHPPMPDLSLSRHEIDDIVEYLDRLSTE